MHSQGLYTFSTVVQALFTLLQCVTINGMAGIFLFISPDIACYTRWQQFLFFVMAIIVFAPIILTVFVMYQRRARKIQRNNAHRRKPQTDEKAADRSSNADVIARVSLSPVD